MTKHPLPPFCLTWKHWGRFPDTRNALCLSVFTGLSVEMQMCKMKCYKWHMCFPVSLCVVLGRGEGELHLKRLSFAKVFDLMFLCCVTENYFFSSTVCVSGRLDYADRQTDRQRQLILHQYSVERRKSRGAFFFFLVPSIWRCFEGHGGSSYRL